MRSRNSNYFVVLSNFCLPRSLGWRCCKTDVRSSSSSAATESGLVAESREDSVEAGTAASDRSAAVAAWRLGTKSGRSWTLCQSLLGTSAETWPRLAWTCASRCSRWSLATATWRWLAACREESRPTWWMVFLSGETSRVVRRRSMVLMTAWCGRVKVGGAWVSSVAFYPLRAALS